MPCQYAATDSLGGPYWMQKGEMFKCFQEKKREMLMALC
jgi:hypothetical protein